MKKPPTRAPGWIGAAAVAAMAAAAPAGASTLRSVGNNGFVSATAAGTGVLAATAQAANAWEDFELVANANGTVSLRAKVSGNFVSADIGLAAPNAGLLVSNRTTAALWEQFKLVAQPDGSVALLSLANNRYVSADQNIGGALIANRATVQAWEEFVLDGGNAATPDFGSSVHVFNPSTPNLQAQIDAIHAAQQSEFGTRRDAILLMPGTYNGLSIPVGYYTQVLGLGNVPDDVVVNGDVRSSAALGNDNATTTFWRGVENLAVVPSKGIGNNTMQWAVSQAAPMRHVHVRGNLKLNQNNGWSSGGWMSDTTVDGEVSSGTQQQWVSRNTQWGKWSGSNWNMVFVGVANAPAGNFPAAGQRYTKVAQTPVIREKPYLVVDAAGNYGVRVPSLARNTSGVSWGTGQPSPGSTLPINRFFIAHPGDSADTINAQLGAGKNILFTPGIYQLTQTLQVDHPDAILLGLGLPTLRSDNGRPLIKTADVDGVTLSGLLLEAGAQESGVLVEVGPHGASASHAANPAVLHDLFLRIGGAQPGRVGIALSVNANDTIVDHTWLWRADHGQGVGWDVNPSRNGLWVDGNGVTVYGLFTEHFQQHQVMWNGDGGRVYFYQSELPYDPPSQSAWNSPTGQGYASYKLADKVASHEAWGLGVYSVFTHGGIFEDRAVEVPTTGNVRLHDMITVCLGGNGGIRHVVDGVGAQTGCNASYTPTATAYP